VKFVKISVAAVSIISVFCLTFSQTVSAASFNPNNIISDPVFDNANTMSASQIDVFLNSFPSSCISQNNGFSAIDPTGYSPSGGYQYGGFVSAGQVIYDAAQAYGINPQVLLTTLQKEQTLVSGGAGCTVKRYTAAVGYGCPDSGSTYSYSNVNLYAINNSPVTSVSSTCVNSASKAGFSQQVIRAAWLLKFGQQRSKGNMGWAVIKGNWNNSDDPQSCYSGPMTQGTYQVCPSGGTTYYDGYRTIDGTAVHMDTGATAALYWYTPHLSGNQSFTNIFTSWFGSPHILYTWQTVGQYAYADSGKSQPVNLGQLGPGQRYYLVITVKNTGNVTWNRTGSNPVDLGTVGPQDRASSFCDSTWINAAPACNRAAPLHEYSVAPGQYGSFEFWITTPAAGSYNEVFAPVMEGVTWMNSSTVSFPMIVNPAYYTWQVLGQYAYTDSSRKTNVDIRHLKAGQRYYLGITMKNTGNMTWNKQGNNPVDLGTTGPQDRTSSFCDTGTWLSCNRPANINEYSVAPGQIGSFNFWVTAPAMGSFSDSFVPVAENAAWMGGGSATFNMSVDPYSFSAGKPTVYSDSSMQNPVNAYDLNPGEDYFVSVNVTNTGTATWSKLGANPVSLGTANSRDHSTMFCHTSWAGCNRAASLHEYSVAPGQTGSFQFWITTPSTKGNYSDAFTPLVEGINWMGTNTIDLAVGVNAPQYSYSLLSQGTYTDSTMKTTQNLSNLQPGQRFYLTATLKNTGNTTWKQLGSNHLSLGTANPLDRTSNICDNSWAGCNRAASLHEYSVAPGQIGSVQFWATAPNTPGNYNEIFAPLLEGITWLNDHTISFPLTVKQP